MALAGIELPSGVDDLLTPYDGYNLPIEDEYETNFGEIVARYPGAEQADVGIVGIPFDTAAVAGARGSREGPSGIRDKFTYWTCYNPGLEVDITTGIDVVDFGNVQTTQTDVDLAHEDVERVVSALAEREIVPISLGGDHSLTYPAAKGMMNATDGSVGVINIDAHHDVRHSHGGELSSGTPFRRLLDTPSGQLAHENFVELGLSGWHNTRYYVDWVKDNGGEVITARDIHRDGPRAAATRALEVASAGTDAVYLSVDIDVLEPGDAPATSVPSPGGLRTHQVLELVYQIGSRPITRGMDVMEVAPPLERWDRITSLVASAIVIQFIGAQKRALGKS